MKKEEMDVIVEEFLGNNIPLTDENYDTTNENYDKDNSSRRKQYFAAFNFENYYNFINRFKEFSDIEIDMDNMWLAYEEYEKHYADTGLFSDGFEALIKLQKIHIKHLINDFKNFAGLTGSQKEEIANVWKYTIKNIRD